MNQADQLTDIVNAQRMVLDRDSVKAAAPAWLLYRTLARTVPLFEVQRSSPSDVLHVAMEVSEHSLARFSFEGFSPAQQNAIVQLADSSLATSFARRLPAVRAVPPPYPPGNAYQLRTYTEIAYRHILAAQRRLEGAPDRSDQAVRREVIRAALSAPYPENDSQEGVFEQGFATRDGMPVGDVTVWSLRARLYGRHARTWDRDMNATLAAQFTCHELHVLLSQYVWAPGVDWKPGASLVAQDRDAEGNPMVITCEQLEHDCAALARSVRDDHPWLYRIPDMQLLAPDDRPDDAPQPGESTPPFSLPSM
ncbi:MAG: hypothetical protein KGL39_21590 [Patescibacteria group bacterium]|nr:hypothetical protein [Patescibacteria group bacterium]